MFMLCVPWTSVSIYRPSLGQTTTNNNTTTFVNTTFIIVDRLWSILHPHYMAKLMMRAALHDEIHTQNYQVVRDQHKTDVDERQHTHKKDAQKHVRHTHSLSQDEAAEMMRLWCADEGSPFFTDSGGGLEPWSVHHGLFISVVQWLIQCGVVCMRVCMCVWCVCVWQTGVWEPFSCSWKKNTQLKNSSFPLCHRSRTALSTEENRSWLYTVHTLTGSERWVPTTRNAGVIFVLLHPQQQ